MTRPGLPPRFAAHVEDAVLAFVAAVAVAGWLFLVWRLVS